MKDTVRKHVQQTALGAGEETKKSMSSYRHEQGQDCIPENVGFYQQEYIAWSLTVLPRKSLSNLHNCCTEWLFCLGRECTGLAPKE